MAERQRYDKNSGTREDFDAALMFDDVERIRNFEKEEEKDQNSKLGSAGLMALLAGAALLGVGIVSGTTGVFPELMEFLRNVGLPIIGFGALGYGALKTAKLVFRDRMLNFPTLTLLRKSSRPESSGITTNYQSSQQSRYQRRTYTYQASSGKKLLRRAARSKRVFSGVAAGLADYLGVAPSLVRFGFVAGLFVSFGLSMFLYLLLSIILPASYDDDRSKAS
jgi:phage shock protein PspC (stress-responsive transcriptional regulator)